MSITADSAFEISNRYHTAENLIFEDLWKLLDSHIRSVASQGGPHRTTETEWTVPSFRMSLPIYNAAKIAKRMRTRLRNRGFIVLNEDDPSATVRFSWDPKLRQKPAAPKTDSLANLRRMAEQVEINRRLGF